MQYIDAVIDNKSVNTDNFYTYKAPDEVGVGAKLTVPFARRSKSVDAYCVRAGVESDTPRIPGKNEPLASSPVTIILAFPKVITGPA